MNFDIDWKLKIRAEIAAADFASANGRNAFSDKLRKAYTARELFLFKEFVGENWGTRTRDDGRECRLIWDGVLEEAKSLIVQVRANRRK